MIIFVGRSRCFPDIDPFNVTATGFRLQDTYQVATWKDLRYLCQIYEKHLGRTPMRFFSTDQEESLGLASLDEDFGRTWAERG
jgi:hypothetical protein